MMINARTIRDVIHITYFANGAVILVVHASAAWLLSIIHCSTGLFLRSIAPDSGTYGIIVIHTAYGVITNSC